MRKILAIALAICVLSVTAMASEVGGAGAASGMDSVMAAIPVISSLLSGVFDLMTGNPLLALFLAAGLVGVGITVFRKVKRAAR